MNSAPCSTDGQRLLVYCITEAGGERSQVPSTGVDGQELRLVEHQDLAAAISPATSLQTLTIAQVLAYQQVVAALHEHRTVLPIQFGCLLAGEAQVKGMLEEHHELYTTSLGRLKGCMEMGIRTLLPEEDHPRSAGEEAADARAVFVPLTGPREPAPRGLEFLKARQAHYREASLEETRERALVDQICACFAGLCLDQKVESSSKATILGARRARAPGVPGGQLASLYFLVRRKMEASFCGAFWQLVHDHDAKLLMSGPWPPYNFIPAELCGNPALGRSVDAW